MSLHTAGHRRGVVCAPHRAAVEDGRADPGRGRQRHRGDDRDGGVDRRGLSAHESYRRRRLLADPRAVGPRARHHGRRPRRRQGDAGFYRDAGHDEIPARGPLAALTVPGAVAGWMLAVEAAKAQRGGGARLPLHVLFDAAIRHAREGYAVTRSQARLTVEKFAELEAAPGFLQTFLVDGKAPEAGAKLQQSAFAATLEQLSHAGLGDFYRGDVGREIAADLERIGSPVTRGDLEKYEARIAEPLGVPIGAGMLYNTPPPTQGLASLMIMALFDRLRVSTSGEFRAHPRPGRSDQARLPRARPFRHRSGSDRRQSQPFSGREISRYAKPKKSIARKAARWPLSSGEGDTIWMGAADASGLVVSYIQSLYWEFGSGCVLPATGVLMQNRGASFSLDSKALNALAPGRLPFHTLNPALAALKDGRVIAYGTMGGDGQPQTQAAVFTRHVLFRQPLDAALDAPRWLLGRTWGSTHTNLRMEQRFDGNLVDRLLSAGHDVDVLNEAYSDTMGHAGAVVLHPNGTLEGAHDSARRRRRGGSLMFSVFTRIAA